MPSNAIDSVKALTLQKSVFAGSFLPSLLPVTYQAGELCERVHGGSGLWAALLCLRPSPDKYSVMALT